MLGQPTLDDGTPTFLTATDDAADAPAAAPAAAPPSTVPNLTLSGLSETPELTPRPHTARPVTTPLDVALRVLEFNKKRPQTSRRHKEERIVRPGLLQHPSLRSVAPPWWEVPEEIGEAADAFDGRHRVHAARTAKMLQAVASDRTSSAKAAGFERSLSELRWNRFFLNEKAAGAPVAVKAATPRKSIAPKWRLEESIWAPRAKECDSRAFYDTEACEAKMLSRDWAAASAAHGTTRFILRHDDDPDADEDGDGTADELEEVHTVLWEHHKLVYRIFDFFAALGSTEDVFHIHSNAFTLMIEECRLAVAGSATCEAKHLDQLFVLVNQASREEQQGADRHNRARALNRQEFLQVLVRVAVARYVLTHKTADVSDALQRLFNEDLDPRLERACHQDSNAFREAYCYTEAVDTVLRRHERSLRNLYNRYASAVGGHMDGLGSLASSKLVSYAEWLRMVHDLNLHDAEFTRREATFCFVWSRMRVVDEASDASRRRMVHLSFEDFLEAIVRMATMKALPFDDEIAEAGCADAGQLLLELQRHPDTYEAFMRDHAQAWDEAPRQPIDRCVDHLLSLIVHTVEGSVKGNHNQSIGALEAGAFVARGASELGALLDQFAAAAAPTSSPRRPTVRRSLSKGGPETHLDAITPQSQVRWAKADGDNR